jgi:ABC-type branched-subunit amino acid transport system substrate-binding protein
MKKIIVTFVVFVALTLTGLGLYYFLFPAEKTLAPANQLTGISKDEILLGTSSALTGHAGFLGSEYLRGGEAYIKKINDEGGIYGRKIKIISYDDQYDPPQTVINTQKLINEDRVFALFNYVGTPTAVKAVPIVEEAQIPLVGLFTGADILRHPLKKYIFNLRPSYYQETEAFINAAVGELGMTKVAIFYQHDDYGFDGLKGAEIALSNYDLRPVVEASYERGTLDVENALKIIKEANPEAVVMVGTYAPVAKFVKLAKNEKFNPLFHSVSFVGSEAFATELGTEGNGVVITEVVPPPVKTSGVCVTGYLDLLGKYYRGSKPTFGGLEGFINTEVLVEGLKKAGPNIDRQKFISALESLDNFSLGSGCVISLGPNNHQGLNTIYTVYTKNGELVPFTDWKELRSINSLKQ